MTRLSLFLAAHPALQHKGGSGPGSSCQVLTLTESEHWAGPCPWQSFSRVSTGNPWDFPAPSVASRYSGGQAVPHRGPALTLPVPADCAAAVAGGAAQGALQAAGGRAGEAAAAAQHRAGKGALQLGSRARISPAGEAQAATLTALLFLRRS